MLVFFIVIVLILGVCLIVLAGEGAKVFSAFLTAIFFLYAVGLGLEMGTPTKSEKGYNVFPIYKVSGNDTISTTWYVREKK